MKPTRGYIESGTNYDPAHITAAEPCQVCGLALGYDTPLLSYGCDFIIHEHCKTQAKESDEWESDC